MAPLTWRNVDAPSFASSNDMYRIAASLMNSGFDSARAGIDRFRDITTEEQSSQLMQNVLNAGASPAAINAAVSGANPAFLTADAIRFANAQPGVLAAQQQAQQTIRANDYNFGRGAVLDARQDVAYERANAMAEQEFTDWTRNLDNRNSAEELVTKANETFGSQGPAMVLRQLQNLAGKGLYSDDVVQAAINRQNAQSILPTVATTPLTGVNNALGIVAENPAARQYPTAWANTDNPVFNGFMGTVAQGVNNPYALAAIQATGEHESGFSSNRASGTWSDPSQSGQAGTSGGIMSWREGRLRAMQEGGTSPEAQGAFFLRENPELIQRLNNASSVEEAQQLMNDAWRFAGYDQPGGEAQARLETARSLLPSYLNGTTPPVGTGAGPTRANAILMNETGQNPLSSGSSVNDLLLAAGNGPRRTQTALTTILDNAAATDPSSVPPEATQAAWDATRTFGDGLPAQPGSTSSFTQQAVQANLDRTAEEITPTVALPDAAEGATDRATMERLLAEATYAPVPNANAVNTGFGPVTEVDNTGSAFTRDMTRLAREGDIDAAVMRIGDAVATGQYGGEGSSPLSNFFGGVSDYFSANPEDAAANADARATANEATEWWRSDEARQFFADNADQIEMAARNPVNFAMVAKEQLAAAGTNEGNAPTGTPEAATPPARSNMTPQERALADREDALAAPVRPSVTVSDNPNVPIQDALNTLMAQGNVDQATNIYQRLDGMLANPTAEGSKSNVITALMEGPLAGNGISREHATNAINELVGNGVTPRMAAAIIEESLDTGGRNWNNAFLGGNLQINMDVARNIRNAFIGYKPDGSLNTAPGTRGVVRAQNVQKAMTDLGNLRTLHQQMVETAKAAAVDPSYSETMRANLAEEVRIAEAEIRKKMLIIEQSGLLSNYSQRQAN